MSSPRHSNANPPLPSREQKKPAPRKKTPGVTPADEAFGQKLKSLLGAREDGGGRKNNRKLRSSITSALDISDTTLYFWQNPHKTPSGRINRLRPTRQQVARLALVIANYYKQPRDELVGMLLQTAGYDADEGSSAGNSQSSAADSLKELHESAQSMLRPMLPKSLSPSSTSLSLGCFFSQNLLGELAAEWKQEGRGGHIIFFWRWRQGAVLRYFDGIALVAFRSWLTGLVSSAGPAKTFITGFVVLQANDGDGPEIAEEMAAAMGRLGENLGASLNLYIDKRPLGERAQQELFDAGMLVSPVTSIPFMMSSYPALYDACDSLSARERQALQTSFNPIMWTTQIIPLDPTVVDVFLNERRIQRLSPSSPVKFFGTDRWKTIELPRSSA